MSNQVDPKVFNDAFIKQLENMESFPAASEIVRAKIREYEARKPIMDAFWNGLAEAIEKDKNERR